MSVEALATFGDIWRLFNLFKTILKAILPFLMRVLLVLLIMVQFALL